MLGVLAAGVLLTTHAGAVYGKVISSAHNFRQSIRTAQHVDTQANAIERVMFGLMLANAKTVALDR